MTNGYRTLQITSVKPGIFGGAVFSGRVVGESDLYTCKASYKVVTRLPQPGECWRVKGSITGHDQFTVFLNVERCNIVSLPVAAYIERLLITHPAFRGLSLGKAKVSKLLRVFGAENLAQLLNTGKVQRLSEVISPGLAQKLVEVWGGLHNEIATIEFLMANKFDPSLANSILKVCRTDTVEQLKRNPYSLMAFHGLVPNLWRAVETLASKLGIFANDPRRLAGLVEHILYVRLDQGHTACSIDELKAQLRQNALDPELADLAINAALDRRTVCVKKICDATFIQPLGAALIESQLEQCIARLVSSQISHAPTQGSPQKLDHAVQCYSSSMERLSGQSLTPAQQSAVRMALTKRVSTLTGFAGTGKTTVLKAIVDIASEYRPVHILALSGKAKERAKEAVGRETHTIHNFLLKLRSKSPDLSVSDDPLIVIDEASMVDIALMLKLMKAFAGKPLSLLLVGDTGQLSPVSFGIFFHALAKSQAIPSTQLTQIHRTVDGCGLQKTALQIRHGQVHTLPIWNGEQDGVFLVPTSTAVDLLTNLTRLKKAIPHAQVLTPHMTDHKPDSGNRINKHLQAVMQHTDTTQGIRLGKHWLRVNDPVIVTQNSYDHNLFNGNTGVMTGLTMTDGEMAGLFTFNGVELVLTRADLYVLGMQLAYAISIHKAQGSEYQASIICSLTSSEFVERSMLYTAISRSKRLALILSTQEIIQQGVSRPNRSDTLCVGFSI